MATRIGLEPTTPSVTGWCSNQLSYRAMIAQVRGVLTAGTLTIIPEKPRVVKQYFQKKTNYFARVVLFRLARAGVCQSKCPEGGARLPQAVGRGMECPSTHYDTPFWALLQGKNKKTTQISTDSGGFALELLSRFELEIGRASCRERV